MKRILGLILLLAALARPAAAQLPHQSTGDLITPTIYNNLIDAVNTNTTAASALLPATLTITTTGSQTALALPSGNGPLLIIANNGSTLTLQGIAPGDDGQILMVASKGAGTVVLSNSDGAAPAANRIITGTGANLTLAAGTGKALLAYDLTSALWRVISPANTGLANPASAAQGDLLVATAANTIGSLPDVAAGQYLRSAGLNTVPAFSSLIKPQTSTITTTGTQTALAIPTGDGDLVIFCNNASLLTIQGITAGIDGQQLTLYSIGAGQVDLAHQNAGATAANRLVNIATSASTSLAAGSGNATYTYDATANRWRLKLHDQGAGITSSFSAGNFTGSGSMTWTLDAGDVTVLRYLLRGRVLAIDIVLESTTVAGTPSNALQIAAAAYGGFTTAAQARGVQGTAFDNGGSTVAAWWITDASNNVRFTKLDGTNWSAATNTTSVYATAIFEVN